MFIDVSNCLHVTHYLDKRKNDDSLLSVNHVIVTLFANIVDDTPNPTNINVHKKLGNLVIYMIIRDPRFSLT